MIVRYPDPILRRVSQPVEPGGIAATTVIERLMAAWTAMDGKMFGLAAPQVGLSLRVFLVNEHGQPRIFLNPTVIERSPVRVRERESCLSLPGVVVELERPNMVIFEAHDPAGSKLKLMAGGAEARAIQHEVDHLDGILIVDKLTVRERREALKRFTPPGDKRILVPQGNVVLPGDAARPRKPARKSGLIAHGA